MKTAVFLLLAVHAVCSGQDWSLTPIPSEGREIRTFVPEGWFILSSAAGDLNGDGASDAALVIQKRDSANILHFEEGDILDTNPRIVLALLREGPGYRLIARNNVFIMRHSVRTMDEPFQGIEISKGRLLITIGIFYSAGSWYTSNTDYSFRLRGGLMELVGATRHETHRASGETEKRDYNFLTKRVKISTGNIQGDRTRTKWDTFQLSKPRTLDSMGEALSWEVEKDVFL